VQQVHAAEPLLNYVQDLIAATRSGRWFLQGLSPRAGIAVLRAAKAQALLANRNYVAPDDVQARAAADDRAPPHARGRRGPGRRRAGARDDRGRALAVSPRPAAPKRARSAVRNMKAFR
jgi:MoxR-like ATPase